MGDRLDTDILGGNNAGFATVAVLTGVDTQGNDPGRPHGWSGPDYLINDLTDLYRPYPAVESDAGQHRCGAATAVVRRAHGPGQRRPGDLDAWRAACAGLVGRRPETATAAVLPGARVAGSLDW